MSKIPLMLTFYFMIQNTSSSMPRLEPGSLHCWKVVTKPNDLRENQVRIIGVILVTQKQEQVKKPSLGVITTALKIIKTLAQDLTVPSRCSSPLSTLGAGVQRPVGCFASGAERKTTVYYHQSFCANYVRTAEFSLRLQCFELVHVTEEGPLKEQKLKQRASYIQATEDNLYVLHPNNLEETRIKYQISSEADQGNKKKWDPDCQGSTFNFNPLSGKHHQVRAGPEVPTQKTEKDERSSNSSHSLEDLGKQAILDNSKGIFPSVSSLSPMTKPLFKQKAI